MPHGVIVRARALATTVHTSGERLSTRARAACGPARHGEGPSTGVHVEGGAGGLRARSSYTLARNKMNLGVPVPHGARTNTVAVRRLQVLRSGLAAATPAPSSRLSASPLAATGAAGGGGRKSIDLYDSADQGAAEFAKGAAKPYPRICGHRGIFHHAPGAPSPRAPRPSAEGSRGPRQLATLTS